LQSYLLGMNRRRVRPRLDEDMEVDPPNQANALPPMARYTFKIKPYGGESNPKRYLADFADICQASFESKGKFSARCNLVISSVVGETEQEEM